MDGVSLKDVLKDVPSCTFLLANTVLPHGDSAPKHDEHACQAIIYYGKFNSGWALVSQAVLAGPSPNLNPDPDCDWMTTAGIDR